MSPRRLLAVARKEWIQIRRDTRSLALAFGLPLFLLIFFGYAIQLDVEDIQLGVLDRSRSQESRQLLESFEASDLFDVAARMASDREIEDALTRGDVRAVLQIPPDFARDLGRGEASVQLLLDGSDANTATLALTYAEALATEFVRARSGVGAVGIEPAVRVWYNPTLESRNMIVPGLVAVIMSVIAGLLTALTIAREWERGTMEQLIATPVQRLEVILGKLLPYLVIGLLDVAFTVVCGVLLFDAPLRGSVALLAVLTVVFLTGALGFGIFVSAALRNQLTALQAALLGTMLPALLLSGFLYDIDGMPLVLKAVSYLVPARYFITVTRGIFLKGVGIDVLWPEALFMVGFAVLGLTMATRSFKKRLA
ncbi:MAG: ABC transporter permease [Gemmatimonadota bacterium]|nr:ABC transporter permease [Gemmatimonadota bacterium]